jgi:hypothetical protein
VLIDLVSVVPFYVDLALTDVDLRATTFMRALRLIRLLRSESYRKSFGAFSAVIRANVRGSGLVISSFRISLCYRDAGSCCG